MNIEYSFEDFEPLIEKAHYELQRLGCFTNGQIIVAMTAENKLYHVVVRELCTMCASDSYIEFIDSLAQRNESHVTKLICMCADGSLSLPSVSFRKKLITANKKNQETEVLLYEENRFVRKKLFQTL